MIRYFDTSAVAAYYFPEQGVAAFRSLILQADVPTISFLVEAEIFSLAARIVRIGTLKAKHVDHILDLFDMHVREGRFQVLPVTASNFKKALTYLRTFDVPIRTADALHLAIASANSMQLTTGDKGLANAAKHHGVDYLLVE